MRNKRKGKANKFEFVNGFMRVKLEDVCLKGSSNLKQSDVIDKNGEYEIYGASGLIGKVDFFHQEKPYIAVVKDGAGIGRTMLLPEKSSVIGTMQYILPNEKVTPKYLYYVIRYMHLEKYFTGATIPHIYFKDYRKEEFNLCDLLEQEKIVSTLSKIETLITHFRTQLEKLDLLVKARFVEMFVGKDYPLKSLDSLSLGKGEYGAQSASVEYDESRPRYVRITDINDDGTLNNDYVSSANIDDDKNYKLSYGDFLFARMGATVGKTYAYLEGNQIYAGYLIRYRLNQNLINPRYLYSYTKLEEYNEWVKLNQSGAAQPGINAKKYGSLLIPVPPLDLQTQFADFVKQVDQSKSILQQELDKTQTLFDSLMQEYFG